MCASRKDLTNVLLHAANEHLIPTILREAPFVSFLNLAPEAPLSPAVLREALYPAYLNKLARSALTYLRRRLL